MFRRLTSFIPGAASILAAVVLMTGCDFVQPDAEVKPNDDEDPVVEIERHLATFLDEAERRGRTGLLYRPSALRIMPEDTVVVNGNELCGFGGVADDDRPEILIAINDGCWDRSTWDREILVFHELGHALLGRGHVDATLPNGLRGSIMVNGRIFGLYSDSRIDWRTYYVDELFDPDTPAPDWANSD